MTAVPKPRLAEIQAWMRWIITEPDGVQAALERPEERFNAEPEPSCLMAVEETPGFSRRERLDVYAEGYYLRILQSMGEDYRAVQRWLGDGEFRSLISDYLLEHPSRNPELLEVGSKLPEYLASWLDDGESPFLPDLAKLEWALASGFFAENQKEWDREGLGRKTPEELAELKLEAAPATALVEADWVIGELRMKLRAPDWDSHKIRPEPPLQEKRYLVVYRDKLLPQVDRVGRAEFMLLQCAKEGLSLGVACDRLGELADVTPELLFQWLSKWASRNAIRCS